MGWLERGSGGPGQLHSPMSTGEDSLAKSLIFGTIKDVAVAPTTREYSGQRTLDQKKILAGPLGGGVTLCPPPLMSLITIPNAGSYRNRGFFKLEWWMCNCYATWKYPLYCQVRLLYTAILLHIEVPTCL